VIDDAVGGVDYILRRNLPKKREFYDDFIDGISLDAWEKTDPATGTAWTNTNGFAYSAPAATEYCRLVSNYPFQCNPYNFADSVHRMRDKKFVLEFTLSLAAAAQIDNTTTFIGLTPTKTDVRGAENILGWFYSSDILCCLQDKAGVETIIVTNVSGTVRLRLEIENNPNGTGCLINWYVNDILKMTTTDFDNDSLMYINFLAKADASGILYTSIGSVSAGFLEHGEQHAELDNIWRVKADADRQFPIVMKSAWDRGEHVTGITSADIYIEYAKEGDASFTAYTPTSADDWIEIDNGFYYLRMGATEFLDQDTHYEVRVRDNKGRAQTYPFAAHVLQETDDEVIDDIHDIVGEGGGAGTYTIYNTIQQMAKDKTDLTGRLKEILEHVRNTRSNVNLISKRRGG
jgi:hypothetical protein